MAVLVETHPRCMDHVAGIGHPERPERLEAVLEGIDAVGLGDDLVKVEPRAASREELERVHPAGYLDALERLSARGGGEIDPDTHASADSWDAAVLAAGAGLDAVEPLEGGEASAAFCAVRPPGHHATPKRPMGFCLLNNAAVCAAALVDRGEQVLILDWDAHHGNGTQDAFYDDPRVAYVSTHQWPLYPGTGRLEETGSEDAAGTNLNLPFPPGTTGEVYLTALDEVVVPLAESFGPTWVLVSCGFDPHRADPLTSLGLSSGDFGKMTERALAMAPDGRLVTFLEGGYDLDALSRSAGAVVATLAGASFEGEAPTTGGPGGDIVEEAKRLRRSTG